MYKRKRYSGKSRTYAKKKRGSFIRPAQRGYIRKSGAYGRYMKDGEMKFLDGTLDDAVVSLTGTITPTINIVVQGTSPVQRIGRKIVIKKIIFHYSWTLNPAASMGSTNDTVRMIIFQDKQCNGAAATVTDILNEAHILASRNLNNTARFRILKDFKRNLNATAAVIQATTNVITTSTNALLGDCFLDVSIPIEYDSTTGVITEIRSNNIGVLYISSNGLANVISRFRLRYTDN